MLRKSLLLGSAAALATAPLAYFQMVCNQEKEHAGKPKQFNTVFDPDKTDAVDVPMMFACKGTKSCIDLRFQKGQYELSNSSMPCAMEKFWKFVQNPTKIHEEKKITFLDARKNFPGDFHDSGFTLVQLENEPETKDWRTPVGMGSDIEKFHQQMDPYLRKLYPNVKRIVWTYNVIRDANPDRAPTDQPTANGPHLDYHQNDSQRKEFHARKPVMEPDYNEYASKIESNILMGSMDTEESKLGVLLGVWKPIFPEKVCDHPLAIMDARTFKEDYQAINEVSFTFGDINLNFLGGGIAHEPGQKWYYYPFQTTKEVLVFHQYSKDRFFANPHTSFFNKNCPKDTPNRKSVEFRVALFF